MKDNDNERTTDTAGIPTYLSLCSGYDGIGIALKRVIPDLRTIAHVEIEAFAIANLVEKMEAGELDACPVFTDLKRFPFEELRERQPTILSAGFPCQPFSSAGKRQATNDPRHLYPFIADGITTCQPEYVFLENVDGIVSSKTADGESVLLYVLRDLETRGYTCTWGTFSAAEVGAPHLRKRVFILAKYVADGESIERQRTESIGDRCERPEETVGGSGSYVADGVSEGLEGHAGDVDETTGQTGRGTHRPISQSGLSRTVYPSRPGERQREWEEPRVVGGELGNADNDGSKRRSVPREEGRTTERSDVTGTSEEERGELADAKSGESGESQAGNRRQDTGGGSEQLGDASKQGLEGVETDVGRGRKQQVADDGGEVRKRPESTGGQLGDASSIGSHRGSEDCTDVEPEVLGTGHESYVADAECIDGRRERREEQARQPSGEPIKDGDQSDGRSEAEPELGGTTDGFTGGVDAITNRVDRLRLLGNGVVPDCAELAFRTLFNQLLHNEQ
jgi:DNA (cytosine-5)-methyltransferase 1